MEAQRMAEVDHQERMRIEAQQAQGITLGARGTPAPPGGEPAIGPNEALIFEVEFLGIVD